MADTAKERARRKALLEELVRMSEEAGLYQDESTPDEIVASVNQVRKELAQDRIIKLLKENSKCKIDGGHDRNGYCFCEAIELIKGEQK